MGSQRIDIHPHAMPRDPLGALGLTRPSRVMVVMAAVVGFTHLLAGFDNAALTRAVTALLGCPYTSRQASYDLRRLKRKASLVRLPGPSPLPTHRWVGASGCWLPASLATGAVSSR